MSDIYIKSAAEIEADALRENIHTLLAECSEAQVAGLHRIHDNAPWKGFDNCPPEKLYETYELVRRTAMSNRASTGGAA